jgi:hypothetical protein
MRQATQQMTLDWLSFFGLLGGLSVLFLCLFFEEAHILAVPALLAVFGSLLYGMK